MTEQNQTPGTAGDDDTQGHIHLKSDDDTQGHMHKSDDDTQGHMQARSVRSDTSDDEDVMGHKHWTDDDAAEDDVTGHTRPS
jgi:hypothetical protein